MKKVLICNMGCDDTTYTEIELTEEELKVLIKIAKENNKNSNYRCKPSIEIYENYYVAGDEDYHYFEYDEKNDLVGGE